MNSCWQSCQCNNTLCIICFTRIFKDEFQITHIFSKILCLSLHSLSLAYIAMSKSDRMRSIILLKHVKDDVLDRIAEGRTVGNVAYPYTLSARCCWRLSPGNAWRAQRQHNRRNLTKPHFSRQTLSLSRQSRGLSWGQAAHGNGVLQWCGGTDNWTCLRKGSGESRMRFKV